MKTLKREECAVLHLGLKRPWFNRIATGEKRIEFREFKPYWQTRIRNWLKKKNEGRTPVLEFQHGYSNRSPHMAFVAGNGEDVLFDVCLANDPVQHPDIGEFPGDRYCLFIGERIRLLEE